MRKSGRVLPLSSLTLFFIRGKDVRTYSELNAEK